MISRYYKVQLTSSLTEAPEAGVDLPSDMVTLRNSAQKVGETWAGDQLKLRPHLT